MHVSPLVWWVTIGVTLAVLLFDVVVIGRRPHEPSRKEVVDRARRSTSGWRWLFGIGVWAFSGAQYGTEFFAGWLTEYSLSVDNLFIFLIIMSKFGVPRQYQQTALLVGIVLALIMRGIFIAVGAAAINEFSWVFYLFGAFLVYTAVKLAKEGAEDEDEYEEPASIKFVERRFPATSEWHGTKLTVKRERQAR